MELSVSHLPPNTYSYVEEENVGLSRKFVENYLLFLCITNQICELKWQSMGWRNLSKDSKKKGPSAHAHRMFLPGGPPSLHTHSKIGVCYLSPL
jgi:hypothetical protein